jgi:hypothetical protein
MSCQPAHFLIGNNSVAQIIFNAETQRRRETAELIQGSAVEFEKRMDTNNTDENGSLTGHPVGDGRQI